MRERVWEWRLPDGMSVRASYDAVREVESVWVGERLVARGRAGRRPEGHLVSAGAYQAVAVRVRFDSAEQCTLYRGWDVVPPYASPARGGSRWKKVALVSGVIVALSAAACAFVALREPEPTKGATPVAVAPNGKSPRAGASVPAPRSQPTVARKAINPEPRPLKPATQFVSAPAPRSAPSTAAAGTQRTARAVR
jgi:hypothetical protein